MESIWVSLVFGSGGWQECNVRDKVVFVGFRVGVFIYQYFCIGVFKFTCSLGIFGELEGWVGCICIVFRYLKGYRFSLIQGIQSFGRFVCFLFCFFRLVRVLGQGFNVLFFFFLVGQLEILVFVAFFVGEVCGSGQCVAWRFRVVF